MSLLLSQDRKKVLLTELRVASSFSERLVGLLATKSLNENQALWIERCNSIHTFFMRFPIDCVFLSKSGEVVKILQDVRPYRMTWPVLRAQVALELASGRSQSLELKVGEKLHVGP